MKLIDKILKEAEDKKNEAAGALIICPGTKRALIDKRGPGGDSPNTWSTFGGLISTGDKSIEDSVKREIKEEAGYEDEITLMLAYTSKKKDFTYYTYLGFVDEEFKPKLSNESTDYSWCTWETLWEIEPKHPGFEDFLDSVGDMLKPFLAPKDTLVESELNKKVLDKTKIKDKEGNQYDLVMTERWDGIIAINVTTNNVAQPVATAWFKMSKGDSGKWYGDTISTDPKYQRKGLMTAIYKYFTNKGYNIRPSSNQSGDGKQFWKGLKKRLNNESTLVETILKEATTSHISFTDECIDSYEGQSNWEIGAWDENDNILGCLEYSIFENTLHISMVRVVPKYQRQGVATKMFNYMRLKHPGMKVMPGMTTEDGDKFWTSYSKKHIK